MRNTSAACAFAILLAACQKRQATNEFVPNPDNEALGEWKHTEKYVSPGTPWHWETVNNGPVLTIHADSTYQLTDGAGSSTFWPFANIAPKGKFGLITKNNWKLTYFIKQNSSDSTFFYPVRVSKDTLELAGMCFEGCIYRFRKIK